MEQNLDHFLKSMPKAELHAHLNGSISDETLKKLIQNKKRRCPEYVEPALKDVSIHTSRTLEEIFKMFPIVHEVIDNAEAVYTATFDVLKEFAEDNVKYLELRTTPKCNPTTGMTKDNYLEAVLKAFSDFEEKSESSKCLARLIVSIDRKAGLANADENVKLAAQLRNSNKPVVGIDLSGDPTIDGVQYFGMLQNARASGLKLTLHMAEVPDADAETLRFLSLPPDRIGHGTHLDRNINIQQMVGQAKIPIEICLTSNVKGLTVDSYNNHHFQKWFSEAHPLAICTDDKGIFQTTLSNEYQIAAETFDLSKEALQQLSAKCLDYSFADEATKTHLKQTAFRMTT